MMSLVRLCRPCLHRLQSVRSVQTVQSRSYVKPTVARRSTQHCQWTTLVQNRCYAKKSGDNIEDLTRDIEELKVMFKDDPELETWLREVDSDSNKNNIPGENTKTVSTATELDREMLRYNIEEFYVTDTDTNFVREVEQGEEQLPISTQRGKHGVFDIEELVELLCIEGLKDICVIRVAESLAYCDYLVLATGRNPRHIKAAAHYVNWFFKQKRKSKDPPTCNIEGLQSDDWLAMDMSNIVLHLMLRDTREAYDIETLWTVGSEFDEKFEEEQDPFAENYEPFERQQQQQDNLLTLSKEVEYAFEEKPDSFVEVKYMDEKQDMESVTEWHNIKRK